MDVLLTVASSHSFYRYVLEPELQFNAAGAQTAGAIARFSRLPHAPLLSLDLRTPTNWLVECVKSVYDLDNIRLADVESLVHRCVNTECTV